MASYVLIPGAGGSAGDWRLLTPLLGDAVAVRLPAADEKAGLAEYAEAVVAAAGDRQDVVVVAHSLGGFTAPLVCDRLPVRELVLVDAMIPAPGETAGQWWANTGQAAARRKADLQAGRDPDREFDMAELFFHDVPPETAAERMAEPAAQSDRVFDEAWPLGAWPSVPTRVISSRDDRVFPVDFQTRVAEERLGITPEQIPGGHMVALSQPAKLAALLTR